MSGGLDSSVAAALLREQGFDVSGVFMRFWKDSKGGENSKSTFDSEKRARMTAGKLGIPFSVVNFEKEFKNRVVDYFLREHKENRTPNPCVVCNKTIKFGLLLEKALELKADYLATGHYARLKKKNNKFLLLKAKDKTKDQSYFLWKLSQEQLKHLLFPVGDYTKDKVREMAKDLGLPAVQSPESMEICFIEGAVNEFLKKHLNPRPGQIVEKNTGKVLGEHQGLPFYTIGQRKMIGLSGGPYYVFKKNPEENSLIVTKNIKDLLKKEARVIDVNWVSGKSPDFPFKAKGKIRYNHPGAQVQVFKEREGIRAVFSQPQKAVTPGQSLVFYKRDRVLGGGIIDRAF